jgi:hypothetical protein
MPIIDSRALGRATLARQSLLERSDIGPTEMVTQLVGLQGQDPDPPYIGLWNRLDGFRIEDLEARLHDRTIVRATLFRGTQHLVTATDYRWVHPMLHSMLERWQRTSFGRAIPGVVTAELAATAEALLRGTTMTRPELGRALAETWPQVETVALARSVQGLLPVVHPPPDGLWRRHGPSHLRLASDWIGYSAPPSAGPDTLVLRYLAAFGPASIRDLQAWSGLTRLREVVDGLRAELVSFAVAGGEELFDLPDAPHPGPDVDSPVRFLPPLDNVVLAHADRSRFVGDQLRGRLVTDAPVLVDGSVRGFWKAKRRQSRVCLTIDGPGRFTSAQEDVIAAEGLRLLGFTDPTADSQTVEFGLSED